MDDYIRRHDAIKAYCENECGQGMMRGKCGCEEEDCGTIFDGIPSADVVEVVRCKDCKHYYFADNRIPQEQRYVCDLDGDRWRPDNFCSYGERREDG